jgi:putative ABC transport system permease protein
MFTLIESVRSAWQAIASHGFRSFLTTLGIVIGVASVIAVISLVQGLRESIGAEFQGLGTNTLSVRSYTPIKERLKGRAARLTPQDLQLIQDRADGINSITPVLSSSVQRRQRSGEVRYRGQSTFTQVQGTTYSYQDVANNYAAQGRFLSSTDNQKRRRVCVIGEQTRKDLELPEDPIGEFVEVGGEWFKVIGVMEARGEMFGISQDDYVLLPYQTMQSLNGTQTQPDIVIQLTIADIEDLETITSRMRTLLRKSHKLTPTQSDDFAIETPEQIAATFNQIINTVTFVVSGIVGISLLVGGIGIMNIMLVSVTERTREIGICKALGARRQHILMQFLIEALALSLLGGLIGLLLGYGLGLLVASIIPGFPPVSVPWWAIALSIGFSGMIGVLFGILPASKAADLNPIDALRYE